MNKSQASFEYLMVFALAFTLLIPTLYFFVVGTSSSAVEGAAASILSSGTQLISSINYISTFGTGSKTTVVVTMPSFVTGISSTSPSLATDNISTELYVNLSYNIPFSLVFFSLSDFRLGNCTDSYGFSPSFVNPGKKRVIVESCGSFVGVYEAK